VVAVTSPAAMSGVAWPSAADVTRLAHSSSRSDAGSRPLAHHAGQMGQRLLLELPQRLPERRLEARAPITAGLE